MSTNMEKCFCCFKSKTGLKQCSRCHAAFYCDKSCQRDDWFIHKKFCTSNTCSRTNTSSITTSADSTTDGKTSNIQAILFPADSKAPRFVKLQIDKMRGSGHESLDTSPFIESQGSNIKPLMYCSELFTPFFEFPRDRFDRDEDDEDGVLNLTCGLWIIHGVKDELNLSVPSRYPSVRYDDSSLPINKSFETLLKSRCQHMCKSPIGSELQLDCKALMKRFKVWRGSILIVKSDRFRTLNRKYPTFQDLTMKETPDLVIVTWIFSRKFCENGGLAPYPHEPKFIFIDTSCSPFV